MFLGVGVCKMDPKCPWHGEGGEGQGRTGGEGATRCVVSRVPDLTGWFQIYTSARSLCQMDYVVSLVVVVSLDGPRMSYSSHVEQWVVETAPLWANSLPSGWFQHHLLIVERQIGHRYLADAWSRFDFATPSWGFCCFGFWDPFCGGSLFVSSSFRADF